MQNLFMVLKLLPLIIEAIKALEAAIPMTGKGGEKMAALREVLTVADGAVDALWPTIEKVVGVLVGLFNKTGVFSKG